MRLISSPVKAPIFEENLFNIGFQYLQAERIGPRASFPISDHQVRWLRSLGKSGEYSTHFLALFGARPLPIPELQHPRADSQKLRDQVEAWLGEVSPGSRLHTTSHLTLEAANLEFSFVKGKRSSGKYRSINVGFGLTYVLPILLAILSAPKGSLLLIENPEAHLHPKGQLQIGRLLAMAAKMGVQIVIETHSDHVLNGIRLAVRKKEADAQHVQLHYFSRDSSDTLTSKILSPNIDHDGRLDLWPEGFFDEFDKALAELI
jgi:predicted ATPase